MPVPNIMAQPNPDKALIIISAVPEGDSPHRKVETPKSKSPETSIFLRPNKSAKRAKGTWKIAVVIRYAVAIQLWETAPIENVLPICGSDRLIAEPINGTRNDARQSTKSAEFLFIGSCFMPDVCFVFF
jgi:hypothetical protein